MHFSLSQTNCFHFSALKRGSGLQQDEEPPIRANTTILLGNLAQHLSEAKTKQMLLNAFFRPLKDTFPPARIAGLKVHASASPQRCNYPHAPHQLLKLTRRSDSAAALYTRPEPSD